MRVWVLIVVMALVLVSCQKTGVVYQHISFNVSNNSSSLNNFTNRATNPANNSQALTPEQACVNLCLKAKHQGLDLDNGPCLSDFMDWNINDYVCDVAHWPRQAVDNLRQNQCDAWYSGLAKHFVEVTPNCEFIRKD